MRSVILFVLICILSGFVQAKTCTQPRGSLAHWLCQDKLLQAADEHLNLAYTRLKSLLKPQHLTRLQRSQQRWQHKHVRCLQSKHIRRCLLRRYDQRTLWLNRQVAILTFRRSDAYANAPTTALKGIYQHPQWRLKVKPLSVSRLLLTLQGACFLRREASLEAQNQVTLYKRGVPQGIVLQFNAEQEQVTAPHLGLQRLCPTWQATKAEQDVVLRKVKQ